MSAVEDIPHCHHGRSELLMMLSAHHTGRAPRIDTTRNRGDATVKLLQMVVEELEDLNVLAYDRQAAREDVVVAGGSRDYALDTNGDARARDAYRALSFALLDAVELLGIGAHDVLRILRSGERTAPRGRRSIRVEELAVAIDHQAKRATSGEYTPIARESQPEGKLATASVEALVRERDELRRRVERMVRQRQRDEAYITTLEAEVQDRG